MGVSSTATALLDRKDGSFGQVLLAVGGLKNGRERSPVWQPTPVRARGCWVQGLADAGDEHVTTHILHETPDFGNDQVGAQSAPCTDRTTLTKVHEHRTAWPKSFVETVVVPRLRPIQQFGERARQARRGVAVSGQGYPPLAVAFCRVDGAKEGQATAFGCLT
jgi:hypothetical protein